MDPGYPKAINRGFDGLSGHITAALSAPAYLRRRESVYFFKRGKPVAHIFSIFTLDPNNECCYFLQSDWICNSLQCPYLIRGLIWLCLTAIVHHLTQVAVCRSIRMTLPRLPGALGTSPASPTTGSTTLCSPAGPDMQVSSALAPVSEWMSVGLLGTLQQCSLCQRDWSLKPLISPQNHSELFAFSPQKPTWARSWASQRPGRASLLQWPPLCLSPPDRQWTATNTMCSLAVSNVFNLV